MLPALIIVIAIAGHVAASKWGERRMGLAICKRIVESHGGRIWVESREGEGARFTLALPAAHDGPPRPRPQAPVAAGAA